jgi:membrane associated rhomboid family serine protease
MSSLNFGRAGGGTPPVVKNLIIINALMLLGYYALGTSLGTNLNRILGLYYFNSPYFQPYQIITHMFMHGSISHLFFNMFALWMFGKVLETVWGSKRFFIYYMLTGLGAVFLHQLVMHLELAPLIKQAKLTYGIENFTPELVERMLQSGEPLARRVAEGMWVPTVGASGAVFGVLLAFGMLFPNTQLMLLFPPIPIKAKYFVIGYGVLELFLGVTQPGSNVAHFAHLGGMLFGFIMIKMWNKNKNTFY